MIPMPPSCARAMASAASVTVSMGALISGMFSSMARVSLVWVSAAQAVILYRSAIRNKTAPTGTNADSGWQWEGNWAGGFVGTPIAPHYFLSASHLGGNVGAAIYFQGKNYTTTAAFDDPNTDL